jgi:hypothetical protein
MVNKDIDFVRIGLICMILYDWIEYSESKDLAFGLPFFLFKNVLLTFSNDVIFAHFQQMDKKLFSFKIALFLI